MKEDTKETLKKGAAIGAGVLVSVAAGFGAATLTMQPDTEVQTVEVPKVVQNQTTEVVEVEKEVPVEVEVPSDNDELFFDVLNERDGDLRFAVEDLDDSEIEQVVDRLAFYTDVVNRTENYVADEARLELHNREVRGETLDRDDMRNIRVTDSQLDVRDFDDEDAVNDVRVSFVHEDERYVADFRVTVLGNEIEDLELTNVTLK